MARQLVYEAEGLTVDLRIDKRANSKALSIVGQVLDGSNLYICIIDRNRQNSSGKGIQGAGMTDLLHLDQVPDFRYHVVGCPSGRFVDDDHAIHVTHPGVHVSRR